MILDYPFEMKIGLTRVFVSISKNQNDFAMYMIMELFNDRALVAFDLFPLFTIPDEKIGPMTESVNWINIHFEIGCMYIDRENKLVKFRKGIMIDNDALDKKELRNALDIMMSTGNFYFDLIKEQLSSNESLEVVVENMKKITKIVIKNPHKGPYLYHGVGALLNQPAIYPAIQYSPFAETDASEGNSLWHQIEMRGYFMTYRPHFILA